LLRENCEQLRAKGYELLDLSMINPDIPPPKLLLDRLIEASLKPATHRYTVAKGLYRLRQAFCEKYESRFGVNLDPESEICVTDGSKDAILHLLAIAKEGGVEHVIMPAPTYPAYPIAAEICGIKPLYYKLDNSEDLLLIEIENLLKVYPSQVLLVNFPHNPTGRTVSQEAVISICKIAAEYNTLIISDFVYGELGEDAPYTSFLVSKHLSAINSQVIEVYSLSKSYSIPGWRIAAALGDKEIISRLSARKANTGYGIFSPLQLAAAAALNSDTALIAPIKKEYVSRYQEFSRILISAGFQVNATAAGTCVWAKLPENCAFQDGLQFALSLLQHEHIVCLPGELFGDEYLQFLRFSMVLPIESLLNAARTIAKFAYTSEYAEVQL
jgi:alanine-synthesizing transaminase